MPRYISSQSNNFDFFSESSNNSVNREENHLFIRNRFTDQEQVRINLEYQSEEAKQNNRNPLMNDFMRSMAKFEEQDAEMQPAEGLIKIQEPNEKLTELDAFYKKLQRITIVVPVELKLSKLGRFIIEKLQKESDIDDHYLRKNRNIYIEEHGHKKEGRACEAIKNLNERFSFFSKAFLSRNPILPNNAFSHDLHNRVQESLVKDNLIKEESNEDENQELDLHVHRLFGEENPRNQLETIGVDLMLHNAKGELVDYEITAGEWVKHL